MKTVVYVIFALLFLSCNPSNQVSEELKTKMFACAFRNPFSTSHDYVVFRVKNLKTGESKEICTTPNLLVGAIRREEEKLKLPYKPIWEAKRYFEFSDDSALWNVGFSDYSMKELALFQSQLNVDSVLDLIKVGGMQHINFGKNDKYFAHIMFNAGVLTTSGCFGKSVAIFDPTSSCGE
jgi:hypothetical protein